MEARWLGRILVIVWLKDDRESIDVRADIYTEAEGWRSLFGWPGGAVSVSSLLASKPSPQVRALAAETSGAAVSNRGTKRARGDGAIRQTAMAKCSSLSMVINPARPQLGIFVCSLALLSFQ